MSLDNVLAVAGAAREHPVVMIFGLGLSIAMMGMAASFIARLLQNRRWIAYVGLAVILYVVRGNRDDFSRNAGHHEGCVDMTCDRVVSCVCAELPTTPRAALLQTGARAAISRYPSATANPR